MNERKSKDALVGEYFMYRIIKKTMKTKLILFAAFYTVFILAAHCQLESQSKKYQKFRLSKNVGIDLGLGNSNTVLSSHLVGDFILPDASLGFGTGFDGAYFFTKNYGVGIKYHFYIADELNKTFQPDETYEVIYHGLVFKEKTHFIGPNVYARWFLFNTKWEASVNMGVMFLHNKLSELTSTIKTPYPTEVAMERPLCQDCPRKGDSEYLFFDDFNGTTLGFTASTGICYRIIPALGVGLRADGFFASLSQMKNNDFWVNDIDRRISRIGVSAEVSVNF